MPWYNALWHVMFKVLTNKANRNLESGYRKKKHIISKTVKRRLPNRKDGRKKNRSK
jgi:hypothetical protein